MRGSGDMVVLYLDDALRGKECVFTVSQGKRRRKKGVKRQKKRLFLFSFYCNIRRRVCMNRIMAKNDKRISKDKNMRPSTLKMTSRRVLQDTQRGSRNEKSEREKQLGMNTWLQCTSLRPIPF